MNHKTTIQESKIIRNTFYVQLTAYIISELTHMLGSVVDGVIIGRCLGVDSMAAFGIISPLMVVFSFFGTVISTGSRNLFTKLIGEGKQKSAQGVFSLSILLSVGFAAFMMAVMLIFSEPIAVMLGASENAAELLPKAKAYLIGIAFSLPAMNAMRVLNHYLPIDNDRNLPVAASIVLTVSDIILDFIAAFVIHGDTLEMGLATSISYWLALIVLLPHFRKKEAILRLTFKELPWKELKGIIMQGIPIGVCRIGFTIRVAFMNRLLSGIASASAIAAYSVYQQTDDVLCSLTIGMADTVAMISGILVGEEDRPRMKRLLLTSVQATFLITAIVSVLAWIFAPQFASFYIKSNDEAFNYSVNAIHTYASGMVLYGLNLIYLNYLQGIGRSALSSVAGFLSESGFMMLSAGILSHWYGADAVWYAFPATQIIMYLFYGIVIYFNSIKMNLSKSGLWDRVLMLPLSFDVPEENRMDCSISSLEEVNALSKDVWNFCEAHGCDEKRKYYLSLAVEEAASNVIQHGFTRDKKSGHSVDVRVIKSGDTYILRIRDDCLIFDPVKQLELISDDDKFHHLGLKMLFHVSKEVRYTCVMKLNNLLIRI